MAGECVCGCGRRLGLKDRLISRRAAKIERDADFLAEQKQFGRAGMKQADLEAFITEGRELRDQLVAVIHGELDPDAIDRSQVSRWRKRAGALVAAFDVAAFPHPGGG